jgi:hypothetical protein
MSDFTVCRLDGKSENFKRNGGAFNTPPSAHILSFSEKSNRGTVSFPAIRNESLSVLGFPKRFYRFDDGVAVFFGQAVVQR